jgi:hypothetical protein
MDCGLTTDFLKLKTRLNCFAGEFDIQYPRLNRTLRGFM